MDTSDDEIDNVGEINAKANDQQCHREAVLDVFDDDNLVG